MYNHVLQNLKYYPPDFFSCASLISSSCSVSFPLKAKRASWTLQYFKILSIRVQITFSSLSLSYCFKSSAVGVLELIISWFSLILSASYALYCRCSAKSDWCLRYTAAIFINHGEHSSFKKENLTLRCSSYICMDWWQFGCGGTGLRSGVSSSQAVSSIVLRDPT